MAFLPDKQVYQSSTDIFGNQYFLLKERGYNSLYRERLALGQLWIKDQRNITQPLSAAIPSLQQSFSAVNTEDPSLSATDLNTQLASGFKTFDVMFDVLELETKDFLLFTKINFNWDNEDELIYTVADDSNIFSLYNSNYAGHWFFPEEKKITFCIVQSSDNGFVYPKMYSIDMDSFTITNILLSAETSPLIVQTTSLQLTSFEQSVFTYNKDTKTYNISFICKGTTYDNIIVESIYLTQLGEAVEYSSVIALTPNS